MSNLKATALKYAARGWNVIPLHGAWIPTHDNDHGNVRCTCIKGYNCKSKGKHPRNYQGSKGASKDPDQIKEWCEEWPFANIGVVTGKRSGFWVIDIDIKNKINGLDSLIELWGEEITETRMGLCQKTPSGGIHILVQWNDEITPSNSSRILTNVDIRSEGGYIVVNPSMIAGIPYEWNDESLEPIEWTTWITELAQLSTQKKYVADKPKGEFLDLEELYQQGIAEGERDTTLFRIASKMRIMDVPYSIALFIMTRMGERCTPFDDEVKQLIVDKLDHAYDAYAPKTKEERKEYAQKNLSGDDSSGDKWKNKLYNLA
jgi:hypothetical protein